MVHVDLFETGPRGPPQLDSRPGSPDRQRRGGSSVDWLMRILGQGDPERGMLLSEADRRVIADASHGLRGQRGCSRRWP